MATDPPLSESERVDHYVSVLVDCVDQCADHRADGHDVLLWNARRASEAILYALAEGTELAAQIRAQSKERKAIDHADLLRELQKREHIHQMVARVLEIMRVAGNLGAHAQGRESVADSRTITTCLQMIPQAVEWFFMESRLKREMPERVRLALADLKSETPRISPRRRLELEIEALTQKVREKSEEADDLRLAHEAARDELRAQQRAQGMPVVAPATVPVVLAPRPVPWKVTALALFGAGLTTGWLLGASRPGAPNEPTVASASPVPGAPSVPATAGGRPPAVVSDTPALPVAAAAPAAPSSATVVSAVSAAPLASVCPAGQRLIPATRLTFARGPHPRPKWPREQELPQTVDVPAFCLDSVAPTTGEFKRFLDGEHRSASRRGNSCNLANKRADLPVNCVSAVEASDFCARQGGFLPTVAQWEAAARAPASLAPTLIRDTAEWARDTFPPAVFGYAAPVGEAAAHLFREGRIDEASREEPWFSWHYRRATEFLPSLSFRCGSPPQPRP